MRLLAYVTIPAVCLAVVGRLPAADDGTLEKLDEALKAVLSFEQGGNSGPLLEVEQIVFRLSPGSALREAVEQRLLQAIDSAGTSEAKRFLCRQLRVVGTEKAVPCLEELLTDPSVAHMARYALGRLETPAASAALHRALNKTSGGMQAGLIDTLAERRHMAAKADFLRLLSSDDGIAAKAAATGLGRLGGTDSVAALTKTRATAPEELAIEIDNALLNCAAQLAAAGQPTDAARIYEAFYRSDRPEQLRFAGLRGLVAVAEEKEAARLLVGAIRTSDPILRRFAISLVPMVKGRQSTEAFASVLGPLPSEDKVLMLRALGDRGDATASAAIIAATKDADEAVRIAAVEALGKLGDAAVVPALAQAAAGADGLEKKVARASLTTLNATNVDGILLELLAGADAKVRIEAIYTLAARGVTAAVSPLLKVAQTGEPLVRRQAMAALGTLASEANFVPMVQIALAAREQDDRSAIIEAMGQAFRRVKDKERCAAPVLAELGAAPTEAKPTLVRLLGKAGSPKALQTVRAARKETDSALNDAAVRALAEWPDTSASDDLLQLLSEAKDPAHKELVLQGYLRLARISAEPAAMYLRAIQRVERVSDKKAVLEGLGLTSEAPEALDVALGYLEDKDLQAAAGVAALRIAHRLRHRDEKRARAALDQVLAKVNHDDVRKRARDVLNEFEQYEDHILQWVGVGPFAEAGKDGAAIYATVFAAEKRDATGIEWKPITQGIGSWEINLEATYGALDFCAAYLRTRVWSEIEQDAQLEMGSDDAIKAWLNGKVVHDQWSENAAAPRQKLVKVKLVAGWNELMLKVVDQQGGWVAACRIRKPDGTRLKELRIQAQ